jgi:phasin family protein
VLYATARVGVAVVKLAMRTVRRMGSSAYQAAPGPGSYVSQVPGGPKEVVSYGSPEDKFVKQTSAAKEAFETVAANAHELAELVHQSRTATLELISKRVIESFDDVKAALEPKPARKAA